MHFCVINSKTIKFTVAILIVAILLSVTINTSTSAQVFFGYSTRKVPVYEVETNQNKIAISFDAAWGADKTQEIINTLKDYNATATFFLVGFWVDKYPEMVKEIDNAGLEIGNHSNTHPDLTTVNQDKLREELSEANRRISEITNKPIKVFRCPYGAYNNAVLEEVEKQKMVPVQWSVDSLDWKGLSASEITQRVTSKVKNGSIILCHNNSDNILPALVMMLEYFKMHNFQVVSVGELIYFENYSVDRNGIQHLSA